MQQLAVPVELSTANQRCTRVTRRAGCGHSGVTAECGLLGKRETSSENRRPLSSMTAAAVFVAIPHTAKVVSNTFKCSHKSKLATAAPAHLESALRFAP